MPRFMFVVSSETYLQRVFGLSDIPNAFKVTLMILRWFWKVLQHLAIQFAQTNGRTLTTPADPRFSGAS